MSSSKIVPPDQACLAKVREQIAGELPELKARESRMREAAEENTFSGELRRAIHGGGQDLIVLAKIAGVTPIQLSEFLTGERTLRSDVLDRIVAAVGGHLVATTSS